MSERSSRGNDAYAFRGQGNVPGYGGRGNYANHGTGDEHIGAVYSDPGSVHGTPRPIYSTRSEQPRNPHSALATAFQLTYQGDHKWKIVSIAVSGSPNRAPYTLMEYRGRCPDHPYTTTVNVNEYSRNGFAPYQVFTCDEVMAGSSGVKPSPRSAVPAAPSPAQSRAPSRGGSAKGDGQLPETASKTRAGATHPGQGFDSYPTPPASNVHIPAYGNPHHVNMLQRLPNGQVLQGGGPGDTRGRSSTSAASQNRSRGSSVKSRYSRSSSAQPPADQVQRHNSAQHGHPDLTGVTLIPGMQYTQHPPRTRSPPAAAGYAHPGMNHGPPPGMPSASRAAPAQGAPGGGAYGAQDPRVYRTSENQVPGQIEQHYGNTDDEEYDEDAAGDERFSQPPGPGSRGTAGGKRTKGLPLGPGYRRAANNVPNRLLLNIPIGAAAILGGGERQPKPLSKDAQRRVRGFLKYTGT